MEESKEGVYQKTEAKKERKTRKERRKTYSTKLQKEERTNDKRRMKEGEIRKNITDRRRKGRMT